MADPNDELAQEALDDEPKNILFALIKQLKIGMDLHRITFPTFVLEPRSMLERITDFMSHQDLVLAYGRAQRRPGAKHAAADRRAPDPTWRSALVCARASRIPKEPSPVKRFLGVVRYFLSGWNIRPKVRAPGVPAEAPRRCCAR